ncbi:transcription initiation factor TFIID subunit 11 [Nematocida major]|uniref:transcription initiation factor TFIID subunit 11 n=1 Tax=Nematocida major TaxID=1912982 RepID=UPI002008D360|nr:transcription initiation factor TFIID subunit 11 [Nematocida major]KAH9386934.1 transcription initiation factor TFIID subunit 11 [Nematocida major]
MREDEGGAAGSESEEEQYQGPGNAETRNLTEEELKRYVKFRRTGFNKGGIRKFVSQVLEQTCNPNFSIVLSGIAKVFVSEIVEEAKEVQEAWEDSGELLPSHVHEAYRRLCKKLPNMN